MITISAPVESRAPRALICRYVIEHDADSPSIREVSDAIGQPKTVTDTIVSNLCREGALKRRGDTVNVGDGKTCAAIARGAEPTKPQPPAPKAAPTKPADVTPRIRQRRTRTRPQQIEVGKIRKGIPCPGWPGSRPWSCPYEFEKMEIGDSFTVKLCGRTMDAAKQNVYIHARRYRAKGHPEFAVDLRKIDDDTLGCWRKA